MTSRQQEAHTLRQQGLNQQEIGKAMGIKQPRVSALLNLNRTLYRGIARYRETDKFRATHREYSKKWARENPGKARAMARRYYAANPEKAKAQQRRYYAANREKILEWQAKYRKTPEGRETQRKANAVYQRTPQGRENHNRAARKRARQTIF